MDNNFEEQFTQNLRATPIQPARINKQSSNGGSRLPLIISVALAAILLIESIALVITLVNYFDTFSYDEESYVEDDDTDIDNYVTDDAGNFVAFNATCTNPETGAYYTFSNNNSYREYASGSNLASSGTYSIKLDSIIVFNSPTDSNKKNLVYDGFLLTDGEVIYECEEPEADTE